MDSYKLFFKRSAEKELRSVPQPFLSQVLSRITSLANQPRPIGIQKLKGENRYYRIRQGDYRIIFDVDDSIKTVTLIKIGHRRSVYDR